MKRRLYKLSDAAALLIAVLIGVQAGLIGHLHADDISVADCVQCQLDNSQAAIATPAPALPFFSAGLAATPRVAFAPFLSHYRLNARGPPTDSW